MNNILQNSSVYLAGPIDNAKDDGTEWRRSFQNKCEANNLFLNILDPTQSFAGYEAEIGKEKAKHLMLKKEGKWEELTDFMKKVVRKDLRQVDWAAFLIAKLDKDIPTCGTYHEIISADLQHKPVIIIAEDGKEHVPSWLFGILDYRYMFDSMDECIGFLLEVNNGSVELSDKWIPNGQNIKENK